jgi:release factor glutamine methyltransferase
MWTQIICKRLNWSSTDLLLNQNERLSESDLLYVRRFVKGLLNNEPFQYIIGETEFFGLSILCDARALIPRPETEELVQWVIESATDPKRIIDLCSGTGCISLALKSRFPNAHVQALDFSTDAVKLSEENAKNLLLDIEVIQENVLDFNGEFISNNKNYDIIVSNPPYIPNKEKNTLSKHVIEHEPAMALFVDDIDPIIFYKEIIKFAEKNLQSGGKLFFELHESYGNEVREFIQLFGFEEIEIRQDLQGKSRMMKAQKV